MNSCRSILPLLLSCVAIYQMYEPPCVTFFLSSLVSGSLQIKGGGGHGTNLNKIGLKRVGAATRLFFVALYFVEMPKRRQRSEGEPSNDHLGTTNDNNEENNVASSQRRTRARVTRASARDALLAELDETPNQAAPAENNSEAVQQALENGQDPNSSPAEELDEEIDNDLTCSLCQDLFCDPVAPPCGHSFCRLCHLRLFHIRLPSEPGIPPAKRSRPCPLCRQKSTHADAASVSDLNSRAKAAHPQLYTRRLLETAAGRNQLNERQAVYFTMRVGNSCEFLSRRTRSGESSRHEWEFFMEMRDGNTGDEIDTATYIQQVTVQVTTGAGQEVIRTAPYTIRRSGVGTERNMCYAVITFKPETRLEPVVRYRIL